MGTSLRSLPAAALRGSGTTPCFGINRGGESPEGSWYRYSTYRTRYLLNILHTAGYDDPILYGPQMSYGTSSWWDLHYIAELSFLTGIDSGHNPNAMGEAFYNFTTGDTYQSWRSPNDYWDLAATLSYDTMTGRSDRSAALEWAPLNVAGGGPNGTTYPGCTSYCGFVQNMSNDIGNNIIFDFLFSLPATDPTVAPPADPRPNFPTDWYDAGNQHILVRSGWSTAGATGTAFSYYAPNTAIDHEDELAGRFDIYSNGEYITKGRIVFVDYNYAMAAANANNEASYMQPANPGCSSWGCFQYGAYLGGGEIWHAIQNGTLSLNHSELPGYVGANLDLTPVLQYQSGWRLSLLHLGSLCQPVAGLPASYKSGCVLRPGYHRNSPSTLPLSDHHRATHHQWKYRNLAHSLWKPESLLYRDRRESN